MLIYAPVYTRDEQRSYQGMKVLAGTDFSFGESLILEHYQRERCTMLLQGGDWFPLRVIPQLAAEDKLLWVQMGAPFDFDVMPKEQVALLRYALKVVPWCTVAKRRFEAAGLTNVTDPIPLGLDTAVWKPLPQESIARSMASLGFGPDTFNIVKISANQERKYLKEQLAGIALFDQAYPEAKTRLYLHSHMEGERNLEDDLKDVGLFGKHCFPDPYVLTQGGFTEAEMVRVVACASVLVSCAQEGFGYEMLQGQALGKPVVFLNEGPGEDLVVYGAGVPVSHRQFVQRAVKSYPSPQGIAQGLEVVWKHQMHQTVSEQAVRHVRERFDWGVVARQWKALIDEVSEIRERYSLYVPSPSARLRKMARVTKTLP